MGSSRIAVLLLFTALLAPMVFHHRKKHANISKKGTHLEHKLNCPHFCQKYQHIGRSRSWAWLSKNMHICECQCLLTSPGQGAVTSRIQVRPSLLSRMDIHCQCVQFNWRWFSGAQARGGEQAFGCRGWRRVWCCTMGDRCSAPAAWHPWHIPFICCKQKVGIGISLN